MQKENRKSIYENLNKFDHLAKKDSFIEVTEWTNGEGFDVIIDDSKFISLTRGQIEAITYLADTLDYGI